MCSFYSFSDRDIPWSNVIAFNSDNCSVMKGSRNGVIAKIRSVQPKIIDVGCVCHLSNLAVAAALKNGLFDVDNLLCEVFKYFSDR